MESVSLVQSPYSFAKYHDLVEDHQSLDFALLPPQPAAETLTAWSEVEIAAIASVQPLLAEHAQWRIDPETRCLLDSILTLEPDDAHAVIPITFAYLSLKLDLPFLQMDHDVCMQELLSRNAHIVTDIEAKALLYDLVREYQLDMSVQYEFDSIHEFVPQEEKLGITRDTVDYLRELLDVTPASPTAPGWPDPQSDESHLKLRALPAKIDELLLSDIPTPVLAPCTVAELIGTDLIPSELPSDDVWTTELEHEVLDMLDCSFESADSSMLQPMHLSDSSNDQQVSHAGISIPARVHMEQLRVTSPILPGTFQDEIIQTNELQEMAALVPSPIDVANSASIDEEPQLLEVICGTALADTNRQLANERLVEIDTTLKIHLPALKADTVSASFDQVDSTTDLLQSASSLLAPHERRWKGLSKIEKHLSWMPFASADAVVDMLQLLPCTAELDLESYLPEDDVGRQLCDADIDLLAGIEVSDTLTPAIISYRQHSEEQDSSRTIRLASSNSSMLIADPINEADLPGNQDSVLAQPNRLQDLLRKRKFELEQEANSTIGSPSAKRLVPDHLRGTRAGSDSLAGQLSRYLAALGRPQSDISAPKRVVEAVVHKSMITVEELPERTLAVPKVQEDQEQVQIIVSPDFVARQALISRMKALLPGLELIEREATLYEADVTLSSDHGLILTTMQKLKQKALPGQVSQTSLKARLQDISLAYRQVDVLVSEGGADGLSNEASQLAEHDCQAFSELVAWCSQGLMTVMYVPGSDSELSRWICAIVSEAKSDASFQLVQEETLWEHFLRMTGLNAFAAQASLAVLRSADPHQPDYGTASLARLASLATEARSSLLANPLDQAVLRRLNTVFDSTWFANRAA